MAAKRNRLAKPGEEETKLETMPPISEEARVLAATVRAYRETRDVRFELAQGVTCMYGYAGLMRATVANDWIHIATVAELDEMDDQQVYDAVMEAKQ